MGRSRNSKTRGTRQSILLSLAKQGVIIGADAAAWRHLGCLLLSLSLVSLEGGSPLPRRLLEEEELQNCPKQWTMSSVCVDKIKEREERAVRCCCCGGNSIVAGIAFGKKPFVHADITRERGKVV